METKKLIITYQVISKIMNDHKMNHNTSFVHVKNWLANKICEQLDKENNNEEFN